MPRHVTIDL